MSGLAMEASPFSCCDRFEPRRTTSLPRPVWLPFWTGRMVYGRPRRVVRLALSLVGAYGRGSRNNFDGTAETLTRRLNNWLAVGCVDLMPGCATCLGAQQCRAQLANMVW
ncbi:hypothetical protein VFPPC_17731 [Pochonia chlamydosporia 170]|uniref:Uncharacterized protein n=1 Tax=Pochonia chlamydosporia 170 TaxID=1380566 RepID=A0A219AQN9_METCM|nr:hypothetical protein VFPPC_17731 [Pochonia chlamydosporia 170]OWT43093.1 hypothetical protein VFPPC_17731 [Pochonia chlamydosporia 170]